MNKKKITEDDDVIEYERTFEKPTTYLNDFKYPVLEPGEEIYKRSTGAEQNEIRSAEWTGPCKIPFDFYCKEVSKTLEETLAEIKPESNEEVISNRPRVYKCPEVSLDDIPDKEMRDMIIKFVYTSETHDSLEKVIGLIPHLRIADESIDKTLLLSKQEKMLKDLKMSELIYNKINPKDVMKSPHGGEIINSKQWDNRQESFLGQPTENFWKNKHVHGVDYDPTSVAIPDEFKKHVEDLMNKDAIRAAHRKLETQGFKPICPEAIPLEKIKFNAADLWLTCNNVYGNFYFENK